MGTFQYSPLDVAWRVGRLPGYRGHGVVTFNEFPVAEDGGARRRLGEVFDEVCERQKAAVVTGAARGIGKAVARRLLAENVEVLAVDIDEGGLNDLAGDGCATRVVDLSDPPQREALAASVEGYDYLVNSAGMLRVKPIFEVTVEEWRTIQTVNAECRCSSWCQQIGLEDSIRAARSLSIRRPVRQNWRPRSMSRPTRRRRRLSCRITRSRPCAGGPAGQVNAICPGIVETEMQDNFLAGVANKRGISAEESSTRSARRTCRSPRRERGGMRRADLVPGLSDEVPATIAGRR